MDTVYYITDRQYPGKPAYIKINNEIGGAIVGFLSKKTADFYISIMNLTGQFQAVSSTEINHEAFYGKENF